MNQDETASSFPEPRIFAVPAPNPVTKGWWEDPFSSGKVTKQRFHDGSTWTQYVCRLEGRLWSDILEQPVPGDVLPD